MSNRQEPKSVQLSPLKLLLGSSILAHILGVWILFIVSIKGSGEGGRFVSAFFGDALFLVVGMPYILVAWFAVTLPLSALIMYLKINEKLFLTTILGVICGALLVLILSLFRILGFEQLSLSSFILALLGGIIAAIFSVLSKVWGKNQGSKSEDDVPSEV